MEVYEWKRKRITYAEMQRRIQVRERLEKWRVRVQHDGRFIV